MKTKKKIKKKKKKKIPRVATNMVDLFFNREGIYDNDSDNDGDHNTPDNQINRGHYNGSNNQTTETDNLTNMPPVNGPVPTPDPLDCFAGHTEKKMTANETPTPSRSPDRIEEMTQGAAVVSTSKYVTFYSGRQFAIFRMVFGFYLTHHFYCLIDVAADLWSSKGMFPTPSKDVVGFLEFYAEYWNLLFILFWNQPQYFVTGLVVCSLVFTTLPKFRKPAAAMILYGMICLLSCNPFIHNPGLPYVGWILLATLFIPSNESLELTNLVEKWEEDFLNSIFFICEQPKLSTQRKSGKKWGMPWFLYWSAYFVLALSYTVSGIHKFKYSESWYNGEALFLVLQNPLANENFITTFLLSWPKLLQYLTWGSLFLEMGFLFFGLFLHLRKGYWLATTMLQIGILTCVNFSDLTLGVVMMHLFVLDIRWFFFC